MLFMTINWGISLDTAKTGWYVVMTVTIVTMELASQA